MNDPRCLYGVQRMGVRPAAPENRWLNPTFAALPKRWPVTVLPYAQLPNGDPPSAILWGEENEAEMTRRV